MSPEQLVQLTQHAAEPDSGNANQLLRYRYFITTDL